MMKPSAKAIVAILLSVLLAICSGCTDKRDYGTEYNPETDCQYSLYDNIDFNKMVQWDDSGYYFLRNQYIYYYNSKTKKIAPLCNKANCMHDKETSESKLEECNAFTGWMFSNYIQYYDGYIYYSEAYSQSLYRVKKDGSKKDKVFTTEDHMDILNWLIHRGRFYFEIEKYYYDEDGGEVVYSKCELKSLPLSSDMKEKNAKIIFESDKEHKIGTLGALKAYKDYLVYWVSANKKDFKFTDTEAWIRQLYTEFFLYNTKTGKVSVNPVPAGYSDTTAVAAVVFLKDKMLFKLGDDLQDKETKFPIYSINYDLTDEKIWLDGVEQCKQLQSYENYVILSDGAMHYNTITTKDGLLQDVCVDKEPHINVEIYSADAERISYFVYPFSEDDGNFRSFGADGYNVEYQDNGDGTWSAYRLKFDDILHCHGEKAAPEFLFTHAYGAKMR